MDVPNYKIVVLGDSGVGKTQFIHQHVAGRFEANSGRHKTVDIQTIAFNTNHGPIRFTLWGCPGHMDAESRQQELVGAQGGILMFSHSETYSLNNVVMWDRDLMTIACADLPRPIPRVLVRTKSDITNVVARKKVVYHLKRRLKYFEVSNKDAVNLAAPLLQLARELTGHKLLKFVSTWPSEWSLQPTQLTIALKGQSSRIIMKDDSAPTRLPAFESATAAPTAHAAAPRDTQSKEPTIGEGMLFIPVVDARTMAAHILGDGPFGSWTEVQLRACIAVALAHQRGLCSATASGTLMRLIVQQDACAMNQFEAILLTAFATRDFEDMYESICLLS